MSNRLSNIPVAFGESSDAVVNGGTVEVTVSFPPITVPVADARNWRRDFIVEMKCRLAEMQLSVQAGGREIAKGYLIARIEDHVGVMLSRITQNDQP